MISWPAQRSTFGEMHTGVHPENAGLSFSPRELGLEVIADAWLLSQCDIFIHGNSNVSNFVLCKSPTLIHSYIPA